MSVLHEMKIGKISTSPNRGGESVRAGTRTRTKVKTAKSLGLNLTPTTSWRVRSQGKIKSMKMIKSGQIKGMKKQAKSVSVGDQKSL